ncbi:MAG: ABC transporter ATP-binding protein/permease [Firmicutes bacterium]|nr:ABC transporter ATP-binding protein/permease [Bacillota bacterium]
MLELKNIRKDYPAGDGTVHALKGISLQFRESEFVSILGPSGCGKTTMLNIIGGLDQYTEGDLVINGRSTKDFKDRDWDAYRNHSIGFVFQSYNLIPHQSVLRNVELALTLSGVSKSERRQRAKKVLEDVGLGDQLNKKPSEMSGGQMQRVAIARALVNNPDIILADEPTGALDTETSVQVMDILKEVAKDRLVIMVTHNPDLAEKYSTRIIRMLDGEILSDTAPITATELKAHQTKEQPVGRKKKPSMSLFTAFGLSLKNLISKKGRTILTSFAGSIGIIGIALIFAVSQGMTSYINTMQEDTLSSYPLTIQATHVDIGSLMSAFIDSASANEDHDNDGVYTKPIVYDMIHALNNMETTENDLTSFKNYIETQRADADSETGLHQAINGVQYTYDLDLLIYTENVDGTIIQSDTQTLLQELVAEHMGMSMATSMESMSSAPGMSMMSMMSPGSGMTLWQEMLPGENGKLVSELLEKQYDVVYGSWPTEYNEIVLVLDENNELDDMTLYALGLKSKADMDAIMESAINKTDLEKVTDSWTYEEICGMEFRTILNADCYVQDEMTGLYTDLRETETGLKYLYDNAEVLKVSGIIKPSEDAVSAMLSGSIAYTSELTKYLIEQGQESEAVAAQLQTPNVDIFTGLPFHEVNGTMTDEEKETEFRNYIETLSEEGKAMAYVQIMCIPSQEQLETSVAQATQGMTREDMEATMLQAMQAQMSMNASDIMDYIEAMEDEEVEKLYEQMVTEQVKMQYAAQVQSQLMGMTPQQLAGALDQAMTEYTTQQCAQYHDEVLEFSETTYEENLAELGYLDLEKPASINLYAATFESKDVIEAAIATYNEGVDELSEIKYTDYVGLMMSSVTSIINAITYVLIAFVAISLVVSSIMIGVITLISVQERTKEIGILRAIGASKRNVSSMFNAETVMIGFASGLLGVVVTYLLCFPINAIIQALTGIVNLKAFLPMNAALILIAISVLLTMFAGIIPSRSAAKKDPVVALRTE